MSKKHTRKRRSRAQTAGERGRQAIVAQKDRQGRVHLLLLQRDPGSGHEHLSLLSEVFQESWQNHLLVETANASFALIQNPPSELGVIAVGSNAMVATSALVDSVLVQAPKDTLACKAGCAHCCYQSVGVTPPEAFTIASHLRETRPPAELAVLKQKLSTRYENTKGFSSRERFSPDLPCPFLVEAKCSIYEVRPLSCRGMNSLDSEDCRSRLHDPRARKDFLDGKNTGRSYMEPIRAFHAISAGVQLCLSEVFGLDTRPLELTGAIHLLLNDETSLMEAWLDGGSPFAAARGGDSTGNSHIQSISGLAPKR